jgi:hypothetical protein
MPTFLTRVGAREYLLEVHGVELAPSALENLASDGAGPRYTRINGRALYQRAWLDDWVSAQAARPVLRRKERRHAATA